LSVTKQERSKKMKKQVKSIITLFLLATLLLAGCGGNSNSEQSNAETGQGPNEKYAELVKVDYDAILASLPELTEEEKNHVVEIGYRDCDHMMACPIGDAAGIYKNLGIQYNVTKTGKVYEAMAAGKMDCAYMGFPELVESAAKGAPLCVAAANHTGGSWYLVVSNDIKSPEDLIGKKLAIGTGAEKNPSWHEVATQLGIPVEIKNYEVFDMKDKDEYFALAAGQLDAFTCCDPWGSYAEYEGTGKIMATSWGTTKEAKEANDDGILGKDAGIHCVFGFNTDFIEKYPNLATRLMYAHILSVQYMYQHPYKAAEIFAEAFDVPVEVALRTVWVKTNEEGRTITWNLYPENFEVFLNEYKMYNIPEEDTPPLDLNNLDTIWKQDPMNNALAAGAPDFDTFIKEKVDPVFPLGMSFDEFTAVAKEIDGIIDQAS